MHVTREIAGYRFKDELTFGDFIEVRKRHPLVDTTDEAAMLQLQCTTLNLLLEPGQGRVEDIPLTTIVGIIQELGDGIKKKLAVVTTTPPPGG
jgi:hypothetical protein